MTNELETWLSQHGRKTQLAKHLGITKGAVSQWSAVPLNRVVAVSEYTGIKKSDIRPDVFGEASA